MNHDIDQNTETLQIHKLRNFFKNVMMTLNHHDWSINFRNGSDSYCWKKNKKINIGLDYDGDIRQIILHEIAHIDTARFCNQKHNFQFWNQMEYFCRKFLNQKLDKNQQNHKKYMSKGHFGIVYRSE
jgi:hypothetical protein